MSKMKLDLDALRVDTFDTLPRYEGAGTVFGLGQESGHNTCMGTCRTCASCPEISCVKPCETNDQNTCMGTCNTCASCPEISCVKACDVDCGATGGMGPSCQTHPQHTCVKACD